VGCAAPVQLVNAEDWYALVTGEASRSSILSRSSARLCCSLQVLHLANKGEQVGRMTHRRPVLLHLAIRYSLIPMSVTSDVQFDRGRKPGRPPVTNPARLGPAGRRPGPAAANHPSAEKGSKQ
jgi:hypothetical protein